MGYMVGTNNTLLLVTVQQQSHAYITHTPFYGPQLHLLYFLWTILSALLLKHMCLSFNSSDSLFIRHT